MAVGVRHLQEIGGDRHYRVARSQTARELLLVRKLVQMHSMRVFVAVAKEGLVVPKDMQRVVSLSAEYGLTYQAPIAE